MNLARKWRTFKANPREAIEYRIATPIRWKLRALLRPLGDAIGRRSLGDVANVVDGFQSRRPGDAFKPDWFDLSLLYNDVRRLKPQLVLEYGSGVSTVVLAQAVRDNGSGRVVSLESDKEWTRINRDALPYYLFGVCEIVHSQPYHITIDGVKGWSFPFKCDADYIYVDGPPGEGDRVVTVDPIYCRHKTIVVDGRTTTKNFLARRLGSFRYRSLLSNDSSLTS